LRRYASGANEAQIRKRHPEDQLNQATCLNLVTNAVIVWNTVYLWEAIEQRIASLCGHPVQVCNTARLPTTASRAAEVRGSWVFPA
jgi:Tn3 transposase DDE domain-containing protein